MKPFIKYFTAGLLCLSATPGIAQPFFHGEGFREHRKEFREEMKKKMDELNLTPDQKAKLKQLREQRQGLRDQRKALWEERKALWESMQDKSVPDATLLQKFHDLNAKQEAIQEQIFKGFLARRAILTQEQFTKMAAFWKEKREEFKKKYEDKGGE